jgi:hypothetical protein
MTQTNDRNVNIQNTEVTKQLPVILFVITMRKTAKFESLQYFNPLLVENK